MDWSISKINAWSEPWDGLTYLTNGPVTQCCKFISCDDARHGRVRECGHGRDCHDGLRSGSAVDGLVDDRLVDDRLIDEGLAGEGGAGEGEVGKGVASGGLVGGGLVGCKRSGPRSIGSDGCSYSRACKDYSPEEKKNLGKKHGDCSAGCDAELFCLRMKLRKDDKKMSVGRLLVKTTTNRVAEILKKV